MDNTFSYTPIFVRGDRRQTIRIGVKDRRSRPRTPGAFNSACDAAYQAIRKTQAGSTGTEVLLQKSS
jgi:hypothetical protein